MTIIKLTNFDGKRPVYVNFDVMAYMEDDGYGGSQVVFDDGEVIAVRESPAEIMDTLRHVVKHGLSQGN